MINIPYNHNVRHTMTNKSDFLSRIIHWRQNICVIQWSSLHVTSLGTIIVKWLVQKFLWWNSLQLHSQSSFHCLMGRKKFFKPIFLKNNKIFPIYIYQKRGSKFHNLTNSCFWGQLLQIFWPYLTEARANLPNVLAKSLWSFLPGDLNTFQLRHCASSPQQLECEKCLSTLGYSI